MNSSHPFSCDHGNVPSSSYLNSSAQIPSSLLTHADDAGAASSSSTPAAACTGHSNTDNDSVLVGGGSHGADSHNSRLLFNIKCLYREPPRDRRRRRPSPPSSSSGGGGDPTHHDSNTCASAAAAADAMAGGAISGGGPTVASTTTAVQYAAEQIAKAVAYANSHGGEGLSAATSAINSASARAAERGNTPSASQSAGLPPMLTTSHLPTGRCCHTATAVGKGGRYLLICFGGTTDATFSDAFLFDTQWGAEGVVVRGSGGRRGNSRRAGGNSCMHHMNKRRGARTQHRRGEEEGAHHVDGGAENHHYGSRWHDDDEEEEEVIAPAVVASMLSAPIFSSPTTTITASTVGAHRGDNCDAAADDGHDGDRALPLLGTLRPTCCPIHQYSRDSRQFRGGLFGGRSSSSSVSSCAAAASSNACLGVMPMGDPFATNISRHNNTVIHPAAVAQLLAEQQQQQQRAAEASASDVAVGSSAVAAASQGDGTRRGAIVVGAQQHAVAEALVARRAATTTTRTPSNVNDGEDDCANTCRPPLPTTTAAAVPTIPFSCPSLRWTRFEGFAKDYSSKQQQQEEDSPREREGRRPARATKATKTTVMIAPRLSHSAILKKGPCGYDPSSRDDADDHLPAEGKDGMKGEGGGAGAGGSGGSAHVVADGGGQLMHRSTSTNEHADDAAHDDTWGYGCEDERDDEFVIVFGGQSATHGQTNEVLQINASAMVRYHEARIARLVLGAAAARREAEGRRRMGRERAKAGDQTPSSSASDRCIIRVDADGDDGDSASLCSSQPSSFLFDASSFALPPLPPLPMWEIVQPHVGPEGVSTSARTVGDAAAAVGSEGAVAVGGDVGGEDSIATAPSAGTRQQPHRSLSLGHRRASATAASRRLYHAVHTTFYDGSALEQGLLPRPRSLHTAVVHSIKVPLPAAGGMGSSSSNGGTAFASSTSSSAPPPPSSRSATAAARASASSRAAAAAAVTVAGSSRDVVRPSASASTSADPSSASPSSSSSPPSSLRLVDRPHMFIMSGWGPDRCVFNDLWALDLVTLRWRHIPFVGYHRDDHAGGGGSDEGGEEGEEGAEGGHHAYNGSAGTDGNTAVSGYHYSPPPRGGRLVSVTALRRAQQDQRERLQLLQREVALHMQAVAAHHEVYQRLCTVGVALVKAEDDAIREQQQQQAADEAAISRRRCAGSDDREAAAADGHGDDGDDNANENASALAGAGDAAAGGGGGRRPDDPSHVGTAADYPLPLPPLYSPTPSITATKASLVAAIGAAHDKLTAIYSQRQMVRAAMAARSGSGSGDGGLVAGSILITPGDFPPLSPPQALPHSFIGFAFSPTEGHHYQEQQQQQQAASANYYGQHLQHQFAVYRQRQQQYLHHHYAVLVAMQGNHRALAQRLADLSRRVASSPLYTMLNPRGCPRSGLYGHSAAVHGGYMYVFGGATSNPTGGSSGSRSGEVIGAHSNDLHRFNFDTFVWSEVIVQQSKEQRQQQSHQQQHQQQNLGGGGVTGTASSVLPTPLSSSASASTSVGAGGGGGATMPTASAILAGSSLQTSNLTSISNPFHSSSNQQQQQTTAPTTSLAGGGVTTNNGGAGGNVVAATTQLPYSISNQQNQNSAPGVTPHAASVGSGMNTTNPLTIANQTSIALHSSAVETATAAAAANGGRLPSPPPPFSLGSGSSTAALPQQQQRLYYPAPRYSAAMAIVGSTLYLHGGDSDGCGRYYQDLWRVELGPVDAARRAAAASRRQEWRLLSMTAAERQKAAEEEERADRSHRHHRHHRHQHQHADLTSNGHRLSLLSPPSAAASSSSLPSSSPSSLVYRWERLDTLMLAPNGGLRRKAFIPSSSSSSPAVAAESSRGYAEEDYGGADEDGDEGAYAYYQPPRDIHTTATAALRSLPPPLPLPPFAPFAFGGLRSRRSDGFNLVVDSEDDDDYEEEGEDEVGGCVQNDATSTAPSTGDARRRGRRVQRTLAGRCTLGSYPCARSGHSMTVAGGGSSLVFFGGEFPMAAGGGTGGDDDDDDDDENAPPIVDSTVTTLCEVHAITVMPTTMALSAAAGVNAEREKTVGGGGGVSSLVTSSLHPSHPPLPLLSRSRGSSGDCTSLAQLAARWLSCSVIRYGVGSGADHNNSSALGMLLRRGEGEATGGISNSGRGTVVITTEGRGAPRRDSHYHHHRQSPQRRQQHQVVVVSSPFDDVLLSSSQRSNNNVFGGSDGGVYPSISRSLPLLLSHGRPHADAAGSDGYCANNKKHNASSASVSSAAVVGGGRASALLRYEAYGCSCTEGDF